MEGSVGEATAGGHREGRTDHGWDKASGMVSRIGIDGLLRGDEAVVSRDRIRIGTDRPSAPAPPTP